MGNKIQNFFSRWLPKRTNFVPINAAGLFLLGDTGIGMMDFGSLIFNNITDLVTDLVNDTILFFEGGDRDLFREFDTFVKLYGDSVLSMIYEYGYVVVGQNEFSNRFFLMQPLEFRFVDKPRGLKVVPEIPNTICHVLFSQKYFEKQASHKQLLNPILRYLNNILNGSNTIAERLGNLIVISPKQPATMAMPVVMDEGTRTDIEDRLGKGYGSMPSQRQALILNKPVDISPIGLSASDRESLNKARFCIEIIIDAIKVPASQVAVLQAAGGKSSLSNGGEIREGDSLRFATYERMFNQIFMNWAEIMGLRINYEISNKPKLEKTEI